MTRKLMLVSALALLAACHKPHNATGADSSTAAIPQSAATAENIPPSGMPEANPAATLPTAANEASAPDFVAKAAASDMFEIQASKLALKRSSNADVKAFAKMMVMDHTKSTAGLKAAIKTANLTLAPPDALPDDKASALNDLTKADPKDFDKDYMDSQVKGHQAALDLMARYANDGDTPALKDFAAATGKVVQQHFDKAKAIKDGLK